MNTVPACKNLPGYGPIPLDVGDVIQSTDLDLSMVAAAVHSHASDSWFTTPMAAKADLVGGVIPTSQIPAKAITDVFTVASQAAMLALTAQAGDVAVRSDTGQSFILATDSPTTLADWKVLPAIGAITSVNGQQGVVVLGKTDIGLANVDNTSDVNKPVSTAQAISIGTKEPTVTAGLSTQYWRGDKTWQLLNGTAVGLGSVDNTPDASKPVSTAQATAIALKEPTITAGTSAQYWRGDKTMQALNAAAVGLGSVENAAASTLYQTLELAQFPTPLTGQTLTYNTTKKSEVIACNHTVTIAAQTFVFPTDAQSIIGQELRLFARSIITTVTLTLNSNTILGLALTTLPVNGTVLWKKVATSTWVRLQ